MTERVPGHLYDFPEYYDLVFASENEEEFQFMQQCFAEYAGLSVKTIFEPACGTGRLLLELARAGFKVSGLDLNEKAIVYCNEQFKKHGFPETAFVGDMADFSLPEPVDAAFNFINSFRHLLTEAEAIKHLRLVAQHLKSGGLYLLGLHLIPEDYSLDEEEGYDTEEIYSVTVDDKTVETRLWSDSYDPQTRIEKIAFEYRIEDKTGEQIIYDKMDHLCYTFKQMGDLLAKVPELQIVETFDFLYDIEDPIEIDEETQDVVYVLRKI